MATYYHGAPQEIHPEGLQTLYLMNPGYAAAAGGGYASDTPAAGNMVLLNSGMNSFNPTAFSHNPQPGQTQHLVGIPLQPSLPPHSSQDGGNPPSIHDAHGLAPRLHYNLWSPAPPNHSIGVSSSWQPSPHRPSGLSLSLSPHQAQYGAYKPEAEIPVRETPKSMGASSSASPNGLSGLQSFLMGSMYLKATQELLDEVVSVGKGIHDTRSPAKSSKELESAAHEADTSLKRGAELTTVERQELQMKKAKLVNMLDEVEQRYRHYRQQMQIVVSSFEAVAGFGSARTYTALALQTISKQFRCLRDAITGQIRTTSKNLGEEDCSVGATKSSSSRLRFVDHQLRQQRALQQLGMIQQNAWRPQRGLPERAVSVLRAWLFEHFLHPYPKDADKIMLAKQAGLTRSQVSNWFINARVRLWKPMVEEMYTEEFKDQEQNNPDEKGSKSDGNGGNDDSASKSSANQSPSRTVQSEGLQGNPTDPKPHHINVPPSSIVGNHQPMTPPSFKKARNDEWMNVEMKSDGMSHRELLMKFMDGRGSGDTGYPFMTGTPDHGGGFGPYGMSDIGRFDHEQFAPRFSGNGGVSLTLGLHNDNLSLSGDQPSYLSAESIPMGRRIEMNNEQSEYCTLNNNPAAPHPANAIAYQSISSQDRKRFAAQLLPDFVA